jgi:hypothetical protein
MGKRPDWCHRITTSDTHRRIRFDALMAFKRQADAERRAALAELAAYNQEIGI